MNYARRQPPARPDVGQNYADTNGLKVHVHAVCQSHVVYRRLPLQGLGVDTRQAFAERFLNNKDEN